MSTETELKLNIPPNAVETLLRHPLLAAVPVHQHLYNTYFDTSDLELTRQKVAVRERRVSGQSVADKTLLTVKTAGQSHSGLSQRHEWEGPTTPGQFDFIGLVDDASLARSLSALTSRLIPIFTTDFERLSWCISMGDDLVEVALDRGKICVNRNDRENCTPICELELELKAGDVNALKVVAEQLQMSTKLTPADDSKAARGYTLFHTLDT